MLAVAIPVGQPAPTSISTFQDGDPAGTPTGTAMGQSIANAVGYCVDHVAAGPVNALVDAATHDFAAACTFEQTVTLNGTPPIAVPSTTQVYVAGIPWQYDPANWTPDFGSQTDLRALFTGVQLYIPLNLPHGQLLTQAGCIIAGSPSTGGTLPTTMPSVSVWASPIGGNPVLGTVQIGATASDLSATPTAYKLAHAVTAVSLAHTIDAVNNLYYLQLGTEASTNSHTGMLFFGARFTITRTSIVT